LGVNSKNDRRFTKKLGRKVKNWKKEKMRAERKDKELKREEEASSGG